MTRFGGLGLIACLLLAMPALAQNSDPIVNNSLLQKDQQNTSIDDDRLENALIGLSGDDLQTERPEREIDIPAQRAPPNGFVRFIANLLSVIGPLLGWLLLGTIALGLIAVLYFMFGESLSFRRKEKPSRPDSNISIAPDLLPDQNAARTLLGDAEALASEGRFAEAVHALLFRSIDLIQKRDASAVKRSFTAREIGQLSGLPASLKKGLSPIIQIVESSYFGGREVDQDEWWEARDAYQSFALGKVTT
ncbi:MAG: hypothetical protein AAGG45_02900 [Pseudomonadota bacterium]